MQNFHPIDSRQLVNFVTLAETRNFTQAAKLLNLTQSAISHSIKSLEEDLGCKLFERIGKKVFLSVQGESMLSSATQILNLMNSSRDRVRNRNSWGVGRLRIAAPASICEYLVPEILREFKESFPQCEIRLTAADSPAIPALLLRNEIDLAISLESGPADKDVLFQRIFSDNLVFAVMPNHPWLDRKRLNRRDIESNSFLCYAQSSFTHRKMLNFFRDNGVNIKNFTEIGNVSTIKELVKIGQGVGLLPEWVLSQELIDGTIDIIPTPYGNIDRNWGILSLHGRQLNLLEETFIGLAHDCCRQRISPEVVVFE